MRAEKLADNQLNLYHAEIQTEKITKKERDIQQRKLRPSPRS